MVERCKNKTVDELRRSSCEDNTKHFDILIIEKAVPISKGSSTSSELELETFRSQVASDKAEGWVIFKTPKNSKKLTDTIY